METYGRMREKLPFARFDHVSRRRDKPAGLAFERKVLRVEPAACKCGSKEESKGCEPWHGTEEVHVDFAPAVCNPCRQAAPRHHFQTHSCNTPQAASSAGLYGW